jgi:hypothetical protein
MDSEELFECWKVDKEAVREKKGGVRSKTVRRNGGARTYIMPKINMLSSQDSFDRQLKYPINAAAC